jgi:hypothetical protein
MRADISLPVWVVVFAAPTLVPRFLVGEKAVPNNGIMVTALRHSDAYFAWLPQTLPVGEVRSVTSCLAQRGL